MSIITKSMMPLAVLIFVSTTAQIQSDQDKSVYFTSHKTSSFKGLEKVSKTVYTNFNDEFG